MIGNPAERGDADLAAVGLVLAEPARARVLGALADGRELPASVLAAEAGVAASTISPHLRRLVDAGFITVDQRGRHRYYTLAGPHIGDLIEAVSIIAPLRPVTSLREGTRAHAVRRARRCYNHLAGRLGVAITDEFLHRGFLATVGGHAGQGQAPARQSDGRASEPVALVLTDAGANSLDGIGAKAPANRAVHCCVDWTEQRHHMAGRTGGILLARLEEIGWIAPARFPRALSVTPKGRDGLESAWGIRVQDLDERAYA